MPKLLTSSKRQREETTEKRGKLSLTRSLSSGSSQQVGRVLNTLFYRLLNSYGFFSANTTDPFITAENEALSPLGTFPNDDFWLAPFGPRASSEDLIFHLYVNNEKYDTMAWLITFCLLDKLHLRYYVGKRMKIDAECGGGSTAVNTTLWVLCRSHLMQAIFTLYNLAFKWHSDYSVPTSYLVSILPHTKAQKHVLLSATIVSEVFMLKSLKFNCFVTSKQITKLFVNFLSPEESHVFTTTPS